VNLAETGNALALAQAYDNRTVGEANVRAWHAILANLDAADVMAAIRTHYLTESAWIMPAHIGRIVGEIQQERAKAAREWAPGQFGVPKEQAMPVLEKGARLTADDISPDVVDLLSQLRASLPGAPREVLFPRQVEWERQQRAYARQGAAEPVRPDVLGQARNACRANGPHDSGNHIALCPDFEPPDCDNQWHDGEPGDGPEECATCGMTDDRHR
jgi:hypothetical protein